MGRAAAKLEPAFIGSKGALVLIDDVMVIGTRADFSIKRPFFVQSFE